MGAGHFAVFVVYGVFAASVRNHVISRPRILAWMRGTYYPGPADLALVHGKTLARPPMLSKAVFFSIRNRNPKLVSCFRVLEPIRQEFESLEPVVIPCVAPESGRGASCGSRNIERRRIVGGCGTRVI